MEIYLTLLPKRGLSACSRMGARARVSLPPGGPGGRSGLVSGGLVYLIGSFSKGAGFGKQWRVSFYY